MLFLTYRGGPRFGGQVMSVHPFWRRSPIPRSLPWEGRDRGIGLPARIALAIARCDAVRHRAFGDRKGAGEMAEMHQCRVDALRPWVRQVAVAMGADGDIADELAGHLVKANLSGHDSHGVLRLP